MTYSTNADCDGTDAGIISATTCLVPIATLRAAPYLLPWGSSVHARIVATNDIGSSPVSADGNGAIILTRPDAPYDLLNDESKTSGTQISLRWTAGANSGGSPVIDYTVLVKAPTDTNFVIRESSITDTKVTLTGFTLGTTYEFQVKSRNEFDYSLVSNTIQVLSAKTPEKPLAPVTSVSGDNVIVDWEAPVDNGSPIIGYTIYLR